MGTESEPAGGGPGLSQGLHHTLCHTRRGDLGQGLASLRLSSYSSEFPVNYKGNDVFESIVSSVNNKHITGNSHIRWLIPVLLL